MYRDKRAAQTNAELEEPPLPLSDSSVVEVAEDYTKRKNVFRLRTEGGSEYLFQVNRCHKQIQLCHRFCKIHIKIRFRLRSVINCELFRETLQSGKNFFRVDGIFSDYFDPEFHLQADNEEAMKEWVKDIEETAVTVVPVLGQGGGGDASTSGSAPVAARKVFYHSNWRNYQLLLTFLVLSYLT